MKRIYNIFALAGCLLIVALGSSCTKEPSANDEVVRDPYEMGEISINQGSLLTRCADSSDEIFLAEIPHICENGDTIYISAYLSDMDDDASCCEPQTRSTLITNSLFGTAAGYTSVNSTVYKAGESACYNSVTKSVGTPMNNVPISYVSSSWRYGTASTPATYSWPSDNSVLFFNTFAPASEFDGSGSVSNMAWDKTNHRLSFDYTSPEPKNDTLDAEYQKDILVGVDSLSMATYSGNVNLKVRHPLVAVKFIFGNIFGEIKYISFNNFYNKGTVTVSKDTVVWNVSTATKKNFKQLYHSSTFDSSFHMVDTSAATGRVSLDTTANKIRTFMLIPQKLASDAEFELQMGNTLHPEKISFSEIATREPKLLDWSKYSGKVLTFRVSSDKANYVSVDVQDETTGCTKHNVKIVNDGKNPIYIRAVLVGNWVNEDKEVLASWSEDNEEYYGTFTSLAGNKFPKLTASSNWKKHTDGFYYYKKIIASTGTVKENLFDTFTLERKPESETTEAKMLIKGFRMSILVQAVIADADNSKSSIKAAWGLTDADITSLGITNNLD